MVLAVLLTSPCWAGYICLVLRTVVIYWFVWTEEDRRHQKDPRYHGYGQPSYARHWKAIIEPLPDLDTAISAYPELKVTRFPSGEWVFGIWISDFGFHQGKGTVVLKDSRGAVRVFFGRVCCEDPVDHIFPEPPQTLDRFYTLLLADSPYGFREWVPDQ